ncbi:hypothetical protein BDP27DRAFT_1353285 [Rhodocollybia butyracea]|uniref:Uncharacterized protein n=1 Tax=Rhodocollybia butyracea TaxID=206335 RepID=A0A9P5P4G1_9AGAR|nr:hypothetical protein BDP27DRAFT_1353285 [Rhodocollybia butyracea]
MERVLSECERALYDEREMEKVGNCSSVSKAIVRGYLGDLNEPWTKEIEWKLMEIWQKTAKIT